MERRERYDPEDLEHLLLERRFDELLEEERAFVLRHVSDRAEYERMRALLQTVQHDERDHPPMDADPVIRDRVVDAFRAQQRPQWTIWLNSVKAVLWPDHASAFWKPALALATVALVVVGTIGGLRSLNSRAPELASLEEKQEKPDQEAPKAVPPPMPSTGEATAGNTTLTGDVDAALSQASGNSVEESTVTTARADAPVAPAEKASAEEAPMQPAASMDEHEQVVRAMDSSLDVGTGAKMVVLPPSHTVNLDDLARNQSTANMTDAYKDVAEVGSRGSKKKERRAEGKATGATQDDGALVGLLRAAW